MECKRVLEYLEAFNQNLIPSITVDELDELISLDVIVEVNVEEDTETIKTNYENLKRDFVSLSEKMREAKNFVLWKEQEIRGQGFFKRLAFRMGKSSVDREEYDIKMKEISQLEKDLDEIRENMMESNRKLEAIKSCLNIAGKKVQLSVFGKESIDELKARPKMANREFKELISHLKMIDATYEQILNEVDRFCSNKSFPRGFGIFASNVGQLNRKLARGFEKYWMNEREYGDEFEYIILNMLKALFGINKSSYSVRDVKSIIPREELRILKMFSTEHENFDHIFKFFEMTMSLFQSHLIENDPVFVNFARLVENDRDPHLMTGEKLEPATIQIKNIDEINESLNIYIPKTKTELLNMFADNTSENRSLENTDQQPDPNQNQPGSKPENLSNFPNNISNKGSSDQTDLVLTAFLLAFAKDRSKYVRFTELLKHNTNEIKFFAAVASLLPWSVEKTWVLLKRAQNVLLKSKMFKFIPEMLEIALLMLFNNRIIELEDEISLEDYVKTRYVVMPTVHITLLYMMYPILDTILSEQPMAFIASRNYHRRYYLTSLHYSGTSVHYHSVG